MIRALIDTNIVLDALASREPFRENAERIFLLAAQEKFQGIITANSITDIYYLVRKNAPEAAAREAIRNLLLLFTIVDICGEDCETALDAPIDDYEDALVAVCADKAGVDFIVTRDEKFLQARLSVPTVAPAGFLNKIAE